MSSANNHCKQFRPRSGPTKVGPDLDLKCLYSDGIHKGFKNILLCCHALGGNLVLEHIVSIVYTFSGFSVCR